MKKITVVFFLSLLFVSCKKLFYKSGVSGKVLDKQSGQPIENVTVYLIGSDAGTSGTPSFNESQKAVTGNDGKFSFSFNRSEYMHYYLYTVPADPTRYYSTGSHSDYIELDFNRKFRKEYIDQNIELLHCGYLKVNFHHTSTDTVMYIIGSYFPDLNPYSETLFTTYGAEFTKYAPPYVDNTNYTFIMKGNTNNKVGFVVSKKGIDGTEEFFFSTNYTFYTTSHDTAYYQFNY